MKKTFINISVAALTVAAVTAPAYAAEPYVELFVGPTFASGSGSSTGTTSTKASMGTGYNVGLGFGTSVDFLPPEITIGTQFNYTSQGIQKLNNVALASGTSIGNSTASLMGVVNYHIDTGTPLGLYAGAGIGALEKSLKLSAGGTSVTLSDREFGYQFQVGADYPIFSNTKIFAEYKFQGSSNWNTPYPTGFGFTAGKIGIGEQSHNLSLGIRFAM